MRPSFFFFTSRVFLCFCLGRRAGDGRGGGCCCRWARAGCGREAGPESRALHGKRTAGWLAGWLADKAREPTATEVESTREKDAASREKGDFPASFLLLLSAASSHRPLAWAVPPFRLSPLAPLAPSPPSLLHSPSPFSSSSLTLSLLFCLLSSSSSSLLLLYTFFFLFFVFLLLSTLPRLCCSIPAGWSSRYRNTLTILSPLYDPPVSLSTRRFSSA